MGQTDVFFMGATQIILGTLGSSVFPTLIKPPAGCVGMQFKLLGAAGSTVQIAPMSVTGASVSQISSGLSLFGYPLVTGEMYPIAGPAAFYIAASGATATVATNFFFSAGATLV